MALRRVAYVDESERGSRVLLAGTVIVGDDAPAVRQVMLSARPAGVAVLHFHDLTDGEKRRALKVLREGTAEIDIRATVYVRKRPEGESGLAARWLLMQQIVVDCQTYGIHELVIERPGAEIDRHDARAIQQARARRPDRRLIYSHGTKSEPVLWIPDALAWAVGRGGEWTQHVPDWVGVKHL